MMKEVKLENGKTIKVRRLSLDELFTVIEIVDAVFADALDAKDETEVAKQVIKSLPKVKEQVKELIEAITNEDISSFTINDIVSVIEAVVEQENFSDFFARLSRLTQTKK